MRGFFDTQINKIMNSNYEIVINDIKLNFKDSKYSTSQLLDNTGLDKNTARDAIKNKTSRSISNYIRFYRLNYAQELLKKNHSECDAIVISIESQLMS